MQGALFEAPVIAGSSNEDTRMYVIPEVLADLSYEQLDQYITAIYTHLTELYSEKEVDSLTDVEIDSIVPELSPLLSELAKRDEESALESSDSQEEQPPQDTSATIEAEVFDIFTGKPVTCP